MKAMRYLWLTVAGFSLLAWATACAGTDSMMHKDMDKGDAKMMSDDMNKGDSDSMSKDMDKEKEDRMSNEMDKGKSERMAPHDNMLKGSDGHHAAGTVSFGMGMNGGHVLTLSNMKVDKVPDGFVYLTKNADRMHGVQVGKLKQFTGTVSFDLPAGVNPDDYDSVVIWCRQYNVEIGRAFFGKDMDTM